VPSAVLDQALANDPGVVSINFARNALFQMKAEEYCEILGEVLKSNTHITSLNLEKCDVTDAAVHFLAQVTNCTHY
jgi:hypothetical protein